MKIVKNVTELVGKTPLLKLNRVVGEGNGNVYVKVEASNPGGSIKDRIALNMIEEAEKIGKLNKDSVLVEPTSGNTGIGMAMIGAAKGYKVILVMPDTMSAERRALISAYGAELVLTDGKKGMKGAIDKADELERENKNYFVLRQFDNESNPSAHVKTTVVEILEQTDRKIDIFVAGVGTGGTLTGIGTVLKKEIEDIKIIAVEPEESAVLSGEGPGSHKIQGIGAGFIPSVLEVKVIDEIFKIKHEDAVNTARELAKKEGLLVGISSGAAIFAALEYSKKVDNTKNIVVIAPDTGERYLSTGLFK